MRANRNYETGPKPSLKKAHTLAPDSDDEAKDGDTGVEAGNLVYLGSTCSQFIVVAVVGALQSNRLFSHLAFILCQLCDLG